MNELRLVCSTAVVAVLLTAQVKAQPAGANGQTAATQEAQGNRIPIMNAQAAVAAGVAQVAEPPFPSLTPQQQQYLDQVLEQWEARTTDVERYQCNFTRWQFSEPSVATNIDRGAIKFSKPDKGLFRVDTRHSIAQKGPNPEYRESERHGEYWICDGEYVHDLDRNEKKATKIQLPPAMRGKGIVHSPLPFLFGVKAAEVKQRYWVRPVAPPEGNNDVWLEAYPKRSDDVGNYSRVQVVIDRTDVLPKALIIFLPNWDPKQPHREVYEFSDRQTNWNFLSAIKQKVFMEEFIPTKLPVDWDVIVEPYIEPQDAASPGQGSPTLSPGQRTAQPPATTGNQLR